MDRQPLYVTHIIEAIKRIEEYTQDGKDNFLSDRKTYDAVLRNLQTMAESTQKISDDIRKRHDAIEWEKIAGFRNILVHDYLGDIDPDLLWEIISGKLPALKNTLNKERPQKS